MTASFLHGFWPDSINSVVPGGWSIATEMSFYLLFPLIIKLFGGRSLMYLSAGFLLWLFNIKFFKVFLLDYLSSHYAAQSGTIVNDFLYLNFASQGVVFFLGCYLFFALRYARWLDCVMLSSWLLIALRVRDLFLLAVFAIGFFVYLCIRLGVKQKVLEMLGRNSYAIYLSHPAVLSLLALLLPLKTGLVAFALGFLFAICASYLVSLALCSLVERRFHRLASSLTKSL